MAHVVSTGFEFGTAKCSALSIQGVDATTRYSYGWSIRLNVGDYARFALNHATAVFGMAFQNAAGYPGGVLALRGDSNATTHITISHHTDGTIKAYRGTTGGTLLGTSAATFSFNAWHYLEVKATLHDTTGVLVVKVNGSEVLNLTGIDTKNGGTASVFDTVEMLTSLQHGTRFDDIYLNDGSGATDNDFWGEVRILTLVPSGDGSSSQLVGSDGNSVSNYLLVDEAFQGTPNTTDYNGSPTSGQKDTYALPDLPTTVPSIKSVCSCLYAAKSDAGAISGRRVLRVGGVDYTGSDLVLAASYQWFFEYLATSPATAAAWTKTEVDGMNAGFEVRP